MNRITDDPNMPSDPKKAALWRFVAALMNHIDNAEPVAWGDDGTVLLLRHYADGSQALVQWTFDQAQLKTYIERADESQRAAIVQTIGQSLKGNTDTKEKLEALPDGVRFLGYLTKPIEQGVSNG